MEKELKKNRNVLEQYLSVKDCLKMLGHELVECNPKLLDTGLEILESRKSLEKKFLHFKKEAFWHKR